MITWEGDLGGTVLKISVSEISASMRKVMSAAWLARRRLDEFGRDVRLTILAIERQNRKAIERYQRAQGHRRPTRSRYRNRRRR